MKKFLKGCFMVIAILAIIIVSVALFSDTNEVPVQSVSTADVTAIPESTSNITYGQQKALDRAVDLLIALPMSQKGIYNQLIFEDFTEDEAQYAVDNIEVEWDSMAYEKGLSYMDIMNMSHDGLIEQLEFEGFTTEQATKAADDIFNK